MQSATCITCRKLQAEEPLMIRGIGVLHTKGLTEEEESRQMKKTFEEITELGYKHIHTLKIIPSDGRAPYFVHRDNVERK